MKFFDYKFIILLALTLIIYFIYREVDLLNARITKLENNINKEETKQIIQDTTALLQATQPILQVDPPVVSSAVVPINYTKNISIDLLPTLNNTLYNIESDSESDNEITHTASQTSKVLAIYSNDNEQTDDTHHSLLESVNLTKKLETYDFNYIIDSESEEKENNIITVSSEHVELKQLNNIIISDSSESDKNVPKITLSKKTEESTSEDSTSEDSPKVVSMKVDSPKTDNRKTDSPKADNPKTDSPIVDSPKIDSTKADSPKADSPKTDSPKTDSPKAANIVVDESSSSEINIVVKTSKGEDSKRKYDRMKLQEIQIVAKEMEINLVKKIKGNDKMKTKNELIKEILKKNI